METVEGLSLLIGSDFYWQVVSGQQRKLSSRLRAVETIFGWALQGCHLSGEEPDQEENKPSSVVANVLCSPNYGDDELSTMWSLETIGIRGEEEEKIHMTEELTKACLKRIGNRYEATIPWKDKQLVWQSNRSVAVSRLNSLMTRLSRDPSKLKEYDLAVHQMIADGIAEPVERTSESASGRIIYLPHRPVYKDTSTTTKLRIVFDASCHTKDIPSLNDQIFTGTNLLPDVYGILLNFRLGRVGAVADIEKAFLQIVLNEADRDAHRFIWYSSFPITGKQLLYKDFRMTKVTFGVSCSPFILSATIRSHLKQEESNFPETCKILSECFYVDDLVVSVDTEDEGVRLYTQAVDIMGTASMNLRKWHSNSQALRTAAGSQEFSISQKVLGFRWSPFSDELAVPLDSVNSFLESNKFTGTKRNILQAIARVYDPLGMVCPTMIKLKILFQSAWKKKLTWDEPLPTDLMLQWNECVRNVLQLKDMTIPRAVRPATSSNVTQCHIFADASINAYGAVVYLQTVNSKGVVASSFLCAKNRVAPLKKDKMDELTLPKLELTAALIAARLCNYIKKTLRVPLQKFFLWTDSKITLHWIYGQTQRWKPYIQSRVVEIRRCTEISSWSHCSGKTNPADLLTRGISGEKLVSSILWQRGPDWLNDVNFLSGAQQRNTDCGELSTMLLIEAASSHQNVEEPILRCEDFNSWIRLLRVTCWVFRFINHSKTKQRTPDRCLSKDELEVAEQYWLRYVQLSSFANDLRSLQKGMALTSTSKVAELSPFLDEHRLLRVGGRLQMLEEAFGLKHPIILPGDHHITALIVDDRHLLTFHGRVSRVLISLRDRFWVIRGRQLVKKRLRSCIVCKKLFGQPTSQPFAPLPIQRITLTRPFDNVGIDFAGPLYYANSEVDGQSKAYILIFTCAAIRAVHLELTTSLSTDSCLMAMRRFIARRGVPSTFLSDNAKTFRRAALELSSAQNPFDSNDVFDFLSRKRIKWIFIVERAPWWGGFWERLIRTVKNTLKVVIGNATLTFEQLRTVLSEAEAVTNDRPLTCASNDPLELVPLTPSKFLIGWSAPLQPTEDETVSESSMRELWKHRMKYSAQISKRWRVEYLQLLRSFHHSTVKTSVPIKAGDVVLLFDPAKPRVHWKMVVVERIFLGRDGKARSCEIRFADGSTLRRPVQLLYPLELANSPCPEDVENK